MSVDNLAQELASQVKTMHSQPGQARHITQLLEKFQLSQQSLQVVALLLMQGTEPETVLHFAAQTVVLKVQSGTLDTSAELESSLFALLAKYGSTPQMSAVLRTLTVAYVDYVLTSYSVFGSNLLSRLSALPPLAQLSVLATLPEEARNPRVFVRGSLRGSLTSLLVKDHSETALKAIDGCGLSIESLSALRAWLRAMRFSEEIRKLRGFGDRYSSAGLGLVGSLGIFRSILAAFHSPGTPVNAAEACGSVMSEALLLTSDTKKDLEFVLLITESVAALCTALRGAFPIGTENFIAEKSRNDWDLIMRSKLACRMLAEVANTHFFGIVLAFVDTQSGKDNKLDISYLPKMTNVLQAMMESALYFVGVRHGEISTVALDFFFHLLSSFQGSSDPSDEDDELFADEGVSSMMLAGLRGGRFGRRAESSEISTVPILQPYFERLLPTLLVALCYPSDPDSDDAFDAEGFVAFRETCAQILSDSCAIVEPGWVIERIGQTLDACIGGSGSGISMYGPPIQAPWQRVEACIHILTAVDPKAAAGQDRVIPMVLNLLPRLVYPDRGTPGLLLRASAGRIVTYTAGYLKYQTDLNLALLSFFSTSLIPGLSAVAWKKQTGEMDLMAFAQVACCQGVRAALHAGKSVLASVEPEKFSVLFNGLSGIVVDERVDLDARVAIIQGLGILLAELRDWYQVRMGLKQLTDKTGEIARQLTNTFTPPSNANANGPAGIKIFFASLQAVTVLSHHGQQRSGYDFDIEDSSSSAGSPEPGEPGPPHPVLSVLEDQWTLVEAVCRTYGCAYEDVAQQACTTFVQIFSNARSFAAGSNILLLVLGSAAQSFLVRPTSSWMHLVKAFVTQFGELTRVHVQLVRVLSELCETFVKHATMLLTRNTGLRALTFDEAKMVAETFAVLSEVLRYVDLVSTVVKNSQWLKPTVGVAIACLTDAEIDAQTLPAVAALLHFSERLMTWIDPPLIMHAAEDTEMVSKETAGIVKSLLTSSWDVMVGSNSGDSQTVIDKLVSALAQIWAVKAAEYPQVLPSVATSLRLGLVSSLAPTVGGRLRAIAERDWLPLLGEQKVRDLFHLLEQNARNGRAFGKIVGDISKDFAVQRKKKMHAQ